MIGLKLRVLEVRMSDVIERTIWNKFIFYWSSLHAGTVFMDPLSVQCMVGDWREQADFNFLKVNSIPWTVWLHSCTPIESGEALMTWLGSPNARESLALFAYFWSEDYVISCWRVVDVGRPFFFIHSYFHFMCVNRSSVTWWIILSGNGDCFFYLSRPKCNRFVIYAFPWDYFEKTGE